MLHHERLDPVVMLLLEDAIGNRGGIDRHLETFAEGLGESLQLRLGQTAQGGQDLADDGRVKGHQAGVAAGAWGNSRGAAMDRSRAVAGAGRQRNAALPCRLGDLSLLLVIERQTEWVPEGHQPALHGVGFRFLESGFMGLA